MKKIYLLSLLALFITQSLVAAEKMAKSPDDIIVTASRIHDSIHNIPANIQVISRESIREVNAFSVPQILNQLGGLNIRGNSLGQFNFGAVVDMGGYGEAANSNTLVLINGQPINPIDSSSVAWEAIPVESIERIEISKGSAGVQYGNRAVGGVINIVTNESAENINYLKTSFGSYGTRSNNALFQNKFNDTLFKISANTSYTDGWRDNSATNAQALNARLTQFFGENNIYFDMTGSQRDSDNPGGVVGTVGQGYEKHAKFNNVGSYFKGENYRAMLGGIFNIGDHSVFESDLTYQNSRLHYKEPYNQIDNKFNRWNLTFSPRLKINLESFGQLIGGYDFSHSYGEDSYLSNAKLLDNSIYAIYRLPLVGSLELVSGARRQIQHAVANDDPAKGGETGRKSTQANAWDIGVNYKLSNNQKVYMKFSQAFRFPNVDEFWGYDPSTYQRIFAGAMLDPQLDKTFQVGTDFNVGQSKFTASIYHTDTSNQIRLDSYTNNNINDPYLVKRQGMYLSSTSLINDDLTLYTNLNIQDVSYTEGPNEGRTLPLAPKITFNSRINYKVNDFWSFGGVLNYVGNQYYAGAHDLYNARNAPFGPSNIQNFYQRIPAFALADVYATYSNGPWEVRASIKNITDKRYATYGGMGFVTTPDSGLWSYYYYPSDPRTLFTSVSYNF